jgi:hypothetical protein
MGNRLLLSLQLCFVLLGFWARRSLFAEQPNVHFKYQLLVVLENVTGEVVTWSTYENYNRLQAANLRTPTVQVDCRLTNNPILCLYYQRGRESQCD